MEERYDVAVVGAGIVGVSTAQHLLMRGKKVLLIDRRGAGQETSYGNAGVIGNTYILPFGFPSWKNVWSILLDRDTAARVHYTNLPRILPWLVDFYLQSRPEMRRINGRNLWPLHLISIDEHRALMRGAEAEHYFSTAGRVVIYRSEASFAGAAAELDLARELGAAFEIMEAEAFREIEPHLRPVYRKAVRWTSSARITNPGALMVAYAAQFVRDGGTFLQTEVCGLNPVDDGLWKIETRQGDVLAAQVVVCTGPWATETLKPLGYRFPLGLKRGYHQHFSAAGSASFSHVFLDAEWGYVLAPMEQGYRLVTGAEFAALHAPPTPAQIDRILPRARELFPLGEKVESTPWRGNRPCFPDSLPVIGPAGKHVGLWFNFGHGHSGMTSGPPSGRLLAEMMMDAKTFCDPYPYRAGRFNC